MFGSRRTHSMIRPATVKKRKRARIPRPDDARPHDLSHSSQSYVESRLAGNKDLARIVNEYAIQPVAFCLTGRGQLVVTDLLTNVSWSWWTPNGLPPLNTNTRMQSPARMVLMESRGSVAVADPGTNQLTVLHYHHLVGAALANNIQTRYLPTVVPSVLTCLNWYPERDCIVLGSLTDLRFWNVQTEQDEGRIALASTTTRPLTSVVVIHDPVPCLQEDDETLVVGMCNDALHVWSWFAPDGPAQYLKELHVWIAEDGRTVRLCRHDTRERLLMQLHGFTSIKRLSGSRLILTVSAPAPAVFIVDVRAETVIRLTERQDERLSPSTKSLIVTSLGHVLCSHNPTSSVALSSHLRTSTAPPFSSAAVSAAITGSDDTLIRLHDAETGAPLAKKLPLDGMQTETHEITTMDIKHALVLCPTQQILITGICTDDNHQLTCCIVPEHQSNPSSASSSIRTAKQQTWWKVDLPSGVNPHSLVDLQTAMSAQ